MGPRPSLLSLSFRESKEAVTTFRERPESDLRCLQHLVECVSNGYGKGGSNTLNHYYCFTEEHCFFLIS